MLIRGVTWGAGTETYTKAGDENRDLLLNSHRPHDRSLVK